MIITLQLGKFQKVVLIKVELTKKIKVFEYPKFLTFV